MAIQERDSEPEGSDGMAMAVRAGAEAEGWAEMRPFSNLSIGFAIAAVILMFVMGFIKADVSLKAYVLYYPLSLSLIFAVLANAWREK